MRRVSQDLTAFFGGGGYKAGQVRCPEATASLPTGPKGRGYSPLVLSESQPNVNELLSNRVWHRVLWLSPSSMLVLVLFPSCHRHDANCWCQPESGISMPVDSVMHLAQWVCARSLVNHVFVQCREAGTALPPAKAPADGPLPKRWGPTLALAAAHPAARSLTHPQQQRSLRCSPPRPSAGAAAWSLFATSSGVALLISPRSRSSSSSKQGCRLGTESPVAAQQMQAALLQLSQLNAAPSCRRRCYQTALQREPHGQTQRVSAVAHHLVSQTLLLGVLLLQRLT